MAEALDVPLRRSLLLGSEVLERASKRRVDWTQIRAAGRSLDHPPRETRAGTRAGSRSGSRAGSRAGSRSGSRAGSEEAPAQREQGGDVLLNEAFSSISGFLSQTSSLCQKYHVSLPSLSESEQTHVCRFHGSSAPPPVTQSGAAGSGSAGGEDFYIEVRPALYSVTASEPRSPRQRQTHVVSLSDGESALLTFHL